MSARLRNPGLKRVPTVSAFETETIVGEWVALIAAVEVQSVVDACFKEQLQQAAGQTFH